MGILSVLCGSSGGVAPVGNIAFRSGQKGSAPSGGVLACTKPTGVVSGDVLYAVFLQDAGALPSLAGWTQLATDITPTNSFPVTVMRKVAGGSEGGSYSFSIGATNAEVAMVAFSGVNATPEDATTTKGTGTAATIAYPTIISTNNNAWHLTMVGNFNALTSTPSGYTLRKNSNTWCSAHTKEIVYGGTTVSGVGSGSGGEWVSFSVLIRSA